MDKIRVANKLVGVAKELVAGPQADIRSLRMAESLLKQINRVFSLMQRAFKAGDYKIVMEKYMKIHNAMNAIRVPISVFGPSTDIDKKLIVIKRSAQRIDEKAADLSKKARRENAKTDPDAWLEH